MSFWRHFDGEDETCKQDFAPAGYFPNKIAKLIDVD